MKNQTKTFAEAAKRDYLGGIWKCAKCKRKLKILRAHNFSHIKPKGKYPELKYELSNIEILCYCCHSEYHGLKVDREQATWLDN